MNHVWPCTHFNARYLYALPMRVLGLSTHGSEFVMFIGVSVSTPPKTFGGSFFFLRVFRYSYTYIYIYIYMYVFLQGFACAYMSMYTWLPFIRCI